MSRQVSELPEEQSQLFLNRMVRRRERTSLLFNWTIQNYSRLRKEVLYKSTTSCQSWRVWLVKAKGTLFTALLINEPHSRVFFSVMSNKSESMRMLGSIPVDISPGKQIPPLYVGEFCRRTVENPEFMQGDELIVQFRYSAKADVGRVLILPYGQPLDSADLYQLCSDFRRLGTRSVFYDFFICCGSKCLKTHKAVLVARCVFFAWLFSKNRNKLHVTVEDNASPRALEDVLHYLYSGEFLSRDVQHILDVLHTAQTFECHSLVRKCSFLLEFYLAEDNVMPVMSVAIHYELVQLKNAAARVMVQCFGRILDVDYHYWEDMESRLVKFCDF